MLDVINMLPKTIDYNMDRYNLKIIYLEDSVPEHSLETVKIYYKSREKVLKINNKKFCTTGFIYQATYELLCIIEDNINRVVVSSDDIVDFESYAVIINKLNKNLEILEINIRKGNHNL